MNNNDAVPYRLKQAFSSTIIIVSLDFDECNNQDTCAMGGECTNIVGSFHCECPTNSGGHDCRNRESSNTSHHAKRELFVELFLECTL